MLRNRFILNSWQWLLIIFLQLCNAEEKNELWNAISFEKKLPYSLKFGLEQNLRFIDQSPRFKQTFTEVYLSYQIINDLVIMMPLRYAIFNDKTKQRVSFAGSYKYDLKPISLKYRLKYQRVFEDETFSDDAIRSKISLRYRLNKRIRPFIAGETFFNEKLNKYKLNEYRLSLGVKVDLSKNKSINIFCIRKIEDLDKSTPENTNVFGFGYNLEI